MSENITPYHVTTPLTPLQLQGAMRVAKLQDEAVMAIFRAERRSLTPSEVWSIGHTHGRQWLLTSVRRSMSNLTAADALVKLAAVKRGPYGKPEHRWVLPMEAIAA